MQEKAEEKKNPTIYIFVSGMLGDNNNDDSNKKRKLQKHRKEILTFEVCASST